MAEQSFTVSVRRLSRRIPHVSLTSTILRSRRQRPPAGTLMIRGSNRSSRAGPIGSAVPLCSMHGYKRPSRYFIDEGMFFD